MLLNEGSVDRREKGKGEGERLGATRVCVGGQRGGGGVGEDEGQARGRGTAVDTDRQTDMSAF